MSSIARSPVLLVALALLVAQLQTAHALLSPCTFSLPRCSGNSTSACPSTAAGTVYCVPGASSYPADKKCFRTFAMGMFPREDCPLAQQCAITTATAATFDFPPACTGTVVPHPPCEQSVFTCPMKTVQKCPAVGNWLLCTGGTSIGKCSALTDGFGSGSCTAECVVTSTKTALWLFPLGCRAPVGASRCTGNCTFNVLNEGMGLVVPKPPPPMRRLL